LAKSNTGRFATGREPTYQPKHYQKWTNKEIGERACNFSKRDYDAVAKEHGLPVQQVLELLFALDKK